MPVKGDHTEPVSPLRREAEKIARDRESRLTVQFETLTTEEMARTVHELRVHQIQLEMQNEELRRTRFELDTQRERYFDLFDLAPVGYVTVNAEGVIIEANLAAAGLLGLDKGALLRQPFSRYIHRDDQDVFYLRRKELLTTGDLQECELRMTAGDGKGFWTHLTATCSRDESGVTVCRIALSDITGRKKAEEELCNLNATLERKVEERTAELRELNRTLEQRVTERTAELHDSEARFRKLFEQHSAVMLLIDPEDGAIIAANHAASEFYGYPRETLQTMNIPEINVLSREEIDRNLRQAQFQKENVFTSPHRRSDGTHRSVEVHSSPITSMGKTLLFSIIHDITEKKRLEEALLLTQTSVDAVSDQIHWLSKDARILDVNPAMCRTLGYTRDELLRMSIHEIDPHCDREKFERIGDVVRKDGSVTFETEHRTKDGRLIPVEVSITPVFRGAEERICAISRDISERKRLESVLRSSEERHRLLFEHAADAIFLLRLDGNFISVNKQACRQYGYERAEFLTLNIADLDTPEQRAYLHERFAALESKGRIDFETVHRDAQGHELPVEVKSVRIMLDGAPCCLSICRDITERKQNEIEIRRYEEIVRSSDDAIISITLDGIVTSWNPGAEKMYGYDAAEMIGKPMTVLLPPDIVDEEQNVLARITRGEIVHHFVTRRICKDGSLRDVSVTLSPITDDKGQIIGASRIAHDISELLAREHELDVARQAADAANRIKSEFLANMSHEIRTPMNGIMGMAQLLQFTELDQQQEKYLDVIMTSAQSLLSLINDVLDLSKIEAGKIELEQRNFSLRSSVSDVVTTQISAIHTKMLSMQTDIPVEVPDNLTGDQLRLKQILLNFLGNAIKFTDQGGIRISVRVINRYEQIVVLNIGVSDTGIGISPEALRKVFDPFVQADASTTRKYGGTGLGLAICTRLAELMGGRVWAESQEGKGSTFYLQIPLFVNEFIVERRDRRSGDRLAALWKGESLRVLLVDDQGHNRFFARQLLEKVGHTVVEARNGREALQQWEQGGFDLLLMDVQMPVMDGIEATRAIREREREQGGHTPIIAVSARALREEEEHIRSQGFDGYLAKPIDFDLLFAEIKRCLPDSAPQGSRETEPPPASAAASLPAVDRDRLAALLGEIEEKLKVGNLAVSDKAAELANVVPAAASVDTFLQFVKRFDFEGALGGLGGIRRELLSPPDPPESGGE